MLSKVQPELYYFQGDFITFLNLISSLFRPNINSTPQTKKGKNLSKNKRMCVPGIEPGAFRPRVEHPTTELFGRTQPPLNKRIWLRQQLARL